jgi:hypothetical protein
VDGGGAAAVDPVHLAELQDRHRVASCSASSWISLSMPAAGCAREPAREGREAHA